VEHKAVSTVRQATHRTSGTKRGAVH